MNKKILNTIFFISIAIAASYNYNQIHKDIKLSDLALANIEALAEMKMMNPGEEAVV